MNGTRMQEPMRWWIIEDALCGRRGHWFEYLRTFQRGLAAEGDDVRFFASRECEAEVAAAFGASTVLPNSIWARMGDGSPKWRRWLRVPAHGLATYRTVSRLLTQQLARAQSEYPDVMFVPTVLVHHLAGWVPLIKGPLRRSAARILLFFPNAPVEVDAEGRGRLLPDPTAKLFGWLVRRLAAEVASGTVVLGAETKPMTKALSEATGVPFTYLPHPVEIDPSAQLVTRHPSPVTLESPLRFGCYGGARWEKGGDVLQAAIRRVLESDPDIPACFALQWVDGFTDERGHHVTVDPWLQQHPKVEVISSYFEGDGYWRQLRETDVMVLPYRSPYRLRVSRVVIEAMQLGMPVIVARRTTLEQQAEEFGAAVACEAESVEILSDAIFETACRWQDLRAVATEKSLRARGAFSVARFRELLLGSV